MFCEDSLEQFAACWEGLEDPRNGNAGLHDFYELLMIALCACGVVWRPTGSRLPFSAHCQGCRVIATTVITAVRLLPLIPSRP